MPDSESSSAGTEYAGDINPDDAWDLLCSDKRAVLIDVRTTAEWSYVGLPDVSSLDKELVKLDWKQFPSMTVNPRFVDELGALGFDADQALLFICRSGARSKDAAIAISQAGFRYCYNVAEGFEGDRDAKKHRGGVGGWKMRGLPWVQE